MADKTGIQWTNATWNPIAGCTIVSPGCTNCYAMREAGTRLVGQAKYAGLTDLSSAGPVWNGQVRLWEPVLYQPLSWKKPRLIFVNSMGDLFHEKIPDEWIDRIFAVMALSPDHTFQVLTKRAARMRAYLSDPRTLPRILAVSGAMLDAEIARVNAGTGRKLLVDAGPLGTLRASPAGVEWHAYWPLPNVWLGTSVERQKEADLRIPDLLATPAAIRFISAEPLLGPIELVAGGRQWLRTVGQDGAATRAGLDWVIVGGESGPSARPMHPNWARSLRDQCAAADVAFFFKQWGEWLEAAGGGPEHAFGDGYTVRKIGKDRAGRLLDERSWDEYPAKAA